MTMVTKAALDAAKAAYDIEAACITEMKEHFDDAQKIAAVTESTPTYHNWGNQAAAKRIDYILISKGDATVSEYHVVNNCHNGVYSSDHASIYIKTKIN